MARTAVPDRRQAKNAHKGLMSGGCRRVYAFTGSFFFVSV